MITTTLAAFPSPPQGVWYLGPIPIRAYAVFIIIGIIVALLIGDRRWAARGGERGVIYDIAPWAVVFGLIGGRLYHVITDWKTYFGAGGAGPLAALSIWDGGLGIWGAVALGAVGAWVGCRRRGIPLPAFGDAIAPGIVLAQAIGRLGNYFNQELYGRETTVPWGMQIFDRGAGCLARQQPLDGVSTGQVCEVVHPTFLYELIWNVLVFVFLIYIDRRFKIGHGRLFALYVAGYCVGRFAVELMRDDFATHIAGIRINSFTATFVFIGAIVYFILAPKGREDPETLRGNDEETLIEELAEDLAAVAAGTGVVAAATVASREDPDATPEPEIEAETLTVDVVDEDDELGESAESEVLDVPEVPEVTESDAEAVEEETAAEAEEETAAETEEEPEDESILEAEVAGAGIETETGAEDEEAQLIDEDHDPVDEDDLESLDDAEAVVVDGPVSEQAEEIAREDAAEAEQESDSDESSAEEAQAEPEAEADAPAEADSEAVSEAVAVEDVEPVDSAAEAAANPADEAEAETEEPEVVAPEAAAEQSEAEPDSESQDSAPVAEAEAEPAPEAEPETEPEAEPDTAPKPEAEPEPQVESEADSDAAAETAESDAAEPDAESDTDADGESAESEDSAAEAEPEAESEAEAEAEADESAPELTEEAAPKRRWWRRRG